MKKIGIFGGTFNPIHNGHLTAGNDVLRSFPLDRIFLVPASIPPHKGKENLAEAEDRLAMIRLAVAETPDFAVSEIELRRSGPSYTIDTVRHFESKLPGETELFFILGMDAFQDIESWKSYQELFSVIPFIVMSRPGFMGGGEEILWKKADDLLNRRVSAGYVFDPEKKAFFHPEKEPVFIVEVTPVEISATIIRERVKRRRGIDGLVPRQVANFIHSKGLYL